MKTLCIRRGLVVAVLVWAMSTAAFAQRDATVRVVQMSVIVSEPRGDADVVATVTPGVVLELLDESGSWSLVRPPDTTPRDWRTGWINRTTVELLGTATTPAAGQLRLPSSVPAPAQDADNPTPTVRRSDGMYYAGIALAGLGAGAILRASFREDSFDNENDRRTTTLIAEPRTCPFAVGGILARV